jgi:small subunit ribosomal protein S20
VANIKSQIKRNRQNNKRRLRNRVYRGAARTAIKDARADIDSGVPETKAAVMQAISLLDRAAGKGVIHKNNAARRKSRLMKAFAKMEPVKIEVEPKIEPVVEKPRKAAPRKRTTKVEEPKVEPKVETKAESKAEPKAKPKKTTVKKTAAKKTTTAPRKKTAKKE